ncbi:hypothetical protein [Clostridium estertheticum]|uniref:hypothetical protein n=1 Tax=Clostridium estertheticum TaxID=238834 RepID=UPI001C0D410C|nr:hypothetical protein [Clostridium estertheticum]MBU3075604.1 hypothetical protein [Clostridium estertheticum]MBU3164814.1 hypothetical protein [Clostridium estertheticum]
MVNSEFTIMLLRLLKLSANRNHEETKQLLVNESNLHHSPSISKGILAEHFISEIIIGNNNWAIVTPMRGDFGIDIIVYSRTGYIPLRCYQIKNTINPLSDRDITTEIEKFRESDYRQLPYYILSISGFTTDKKYLNHQNIFLVDFEYVISLINSYSKHLNTNPGSTYYLRDDHFMLNFDEFLKLKYKFGRYLYDHLSPKMTQWFTKIRNQKRYGTLNIKLFLLMDSKGFYWSHRLYLWDKVFIELNNVYEKYGTTFEKIILPQHKAWINRQLDDYLNGRLSPSKIKKLQSINLINEWLLNRYTL